MCLRCELCTLCLVDHRRHRVCPQWRPEEAPLELRVPDCHTRRRVQLADWGEHWLQKLNLETMYVRMCVCTYVCTVCGRWRCDSGWCDCEGLVYQLTNAFTAEASWAHLQLLRCLTHNPVHVTIDRMVKNSSISARNRLKNLAILGVREPFTFRW